MTPLPLKLEEPFGDARLAELGLLSRADQDGRLAIGSVPDGPWRDLILCLVSAGLIASFSYDEAKSFAISTGHGASPDMVGLSGMSGESLLERAITRARVRALDGIYRNEGGMFRLTHFGRVRLSELRQALRAGRERDPLGVLWDVRHWEQDLQVALFETSDSVPLCVAYMDMNGLKALNDAYGHDAGDHGLRAYFQAVASVLGDSGQAYRLGGDEVLAVFADLGLDAAAHRVEAACHRLMADRLQIGEKTVFLSIAAGVVGVTDRVRTPMAVRSAADREQKRAKDASRNHAPPRPSAIAVAGVEVKEINFETNV